MCARPKNPRPRVDKIETAKRIFVIQGWILDGVQSALICRQIIQNGWCTSQRHAERLLSKARKEWVKVPEAELAEKKLLKIAELQQLKRSLKDPYKGTPQGIRAVMSVETKIIDLLFPATTKMEISGANGLPIQTQSSSVVLYLPSNGREVKDE